MSTVLVVVAHPDDEALHCGGFIAQAAKRGDTVVTVTLTRGGAGRTLGICEASELPAVREAELRNAAGVLGISHPEVHDLPDGGVTGRPTDAARIVAQALRRWTPTTLVTFPPNGVNGHPDHMAVHRTCMAAVGRNRVRPSAILLIADGAEFNHSARPGYLTPAEVNRLRLPATEDVDVHDVAGAKLRALGCYETQARSITKFLRRSPERVFVESFHRYGEREAPALRPGLHDDPP